MSDGAVSRAFWIAAPGRGEIRAAPLSPPGPGEVAVRARISAVSRGTESLVFRGRVPPSEYRVMRCPFQEGDFPAPVKYGYASVGVVDRDPGGDPGSGDAPAQGQRVFCLYPHQDRYAVPLDAVLALADDLPDRRAALAANMETAVNALWDAGPRLGDRIAVVGGGVVGCLVAALAAHIPAASVELVDVNPARADTAARLGARFAAPDAAAPDADIVFHASGTADGLATALRLAGEETTVLELSWYGDAAVAAPLGAAFHSRRLTLRASQVGAVSRARRARRSRRDRLALALELLRDPAFDCLITGQSAFADLPETMARLAADPGDELCHLVVYP